MKLVRPEVDPVRDKFAAARKELDGIIDRQKPITSPNSCASTPRRRRNDAVASA